MISGFRSKNKMSELQAENRIAHIQEAWIWKCKYVQLMTCCQPVLLPFSKWSLNRFALPVLFYPVQVLSTFLLPSDWLMAATSSQDAMWPGWGRSLPSTLAKVQLW